MQHCQNKKLIGSLRSNNSIGKRISKKIETLQVFSGFSTNALMVSKNAKHWKRMWLDEVADVLKESQLQARLKTWTPTDVIDEKNMMDHACEHAETTEDMLMTSKARMWKKASFIFEIIEQNGKTPMRLVQRRCFI